MADTLPANPSPDNGITRERKPNVKVAQFGDGYSQRNSFGKNQIAMDLTLTWTNISAAEKTILENFFNAHARGQAFFYTMPDEATPRKWYIGEEGWQVTYIKYGIYAVSLKLKECFDII